MHKILKFHSSRLVLAFALLILVDFPPAAAQEPEKKQEENARNTEQSPALQSKTLIPPVLPTRGSSIALPDKNPTRFSLTATRSASAPPQVGTGNPDQWGYQLMPYIWFPRIDGELEVLDEEVPFDASFGDLFDKLNFAFMMTFEARKGRWGIGTDLMYINLDAENTNSDRLVFIGSEVTEKLFMIGPEVAYRAVESENAYLDILGGFRYWHSSLDVDLTRRVLPPISASETDNWVDPLIGVRVGGQFGKGWGGVVNVDVGGFGAGTDFAWQAFGGLSKDFKERYSFLFGFRGLGLHFDDSHVLRRLTFYGPVMGMKLKFGANQ